MRLALAVLLLFTLGCSRDDKFFQQYTPFDEGRFTKQYKMDTTTADSSAVDVDILWVIDNSGSMQTYQNRVIANSASFIQQFKSSSRLQWKMGLISTDQSNPPYMGFASPVDWTHPDPVSTFNAAVARLGIAGSGIEQSFDPTLKALRNNPSFLRNNAYFVMIIVTDELEQSSISTAEFVRQIVGRVGSLAKFFVYGVYTPFSNNSWNQKNNEIVATTNGKTYPLDSNNYGVLLSDLGKDLVTKVTAAYPFVVLDQKPKVDTIRVVYKGRALTPGTDWLYNSEYNYVQIINVSLLDPGQLDIEVSFEIDRN